MVDIKSMTQEEMGEYFRQLGEPAFRATQVLPGLHRGAPAFGEMSSPSKALRAKPAAAGRTTASGSAGGSERV